MNAPSYRGIFKAQQMKNDGILNFNYSLQPQKYVEMEMDVKQKLRNMSYNAKIHRELKRYSDKYIESILTDDIMSTVNIELMSPELIKMFGADFKKEVDVIQRDLNSSSNDEEEDDDETKRSLGGGDDYSEYFNDEDDFINENNAVENDFMF